MNRTQRYPRRSFVRNTAGVVAGLSGLEVLAACSGLGGLSAGSDASNGELSATVSNMPPDSDKTGLQQFKDTVAKFEKLHPKQHIVGHTYTFDPTTYYARLAAGQAEDGLLTYFTEPQFMIAHHYASDITNLIKNWQYFTSIDPNILQIVTGPDKHIYGVPVSGYALCVLYSRSLFKQALENPGLDVDVKLGPLRLVDEVDEPLQVDRVVEAGLGLGVDVAEDARRLAEPPQNVGVVVGQIAPAPVPEGRPLAPLRDLDALLVRHL